MEIEIQVSENTGNQAPDIAEVLDLLNQEEIPFSSYEILQKGYTKAIKFVLKDGSSIPSFFVKYGEKVDKECDLYNDPAFDTDIFPQRILTGNSNLLILPYLDGLSLEDIFLDRDMNMDLCYEVLNTVWEKFWSKSALVESTEKGKIRKFVDAHISRLFSDINFKDGVSFTDLANKSIRLVKNGNEYTLPSLLTMIDDVLNMIDESDNYISAFR